MLIFDVVGDAVEEIVSPDLCGVACSGDGFAFTTGTGVFSRDDATAVVHAGLAFDNHLVAVAGG
jgi:hypothetical protein